MNHFPETARQPSNVAEVSNILRRLRGLMLRRKTVCILGGAVLAAAYASLSITSDSTIQAAQLGNEPVGASGMLIMPRGADTQTGMVPAWRTSSVGSDSSSEADRAIRSVPSNPFKGASAARADIAAAIDSIRHRSKRRAVGGASRR
jgi:hypothetical protein